MAPLPPALAGESLALTLTLTLTDLDHDTTNRGPSPRPNPSPAEPWQGGRLPLPTPLLSGASYTLSVCAADHLGLQSCSHWPFKVDLEPPECGGLADLISDVASPEYFYVAG